MNTIYGPWADRVEAGEELGRAVFDRLGPTPDAIVLGLPRGGVVVAAEVAEVMAAELDVLTVRKAGVPGHDELALGAVGIGGARVRNDDVIRAARLSPAAVESAFARAEDEAHRRDLLLREGRPAPRTSGRTTIVVDDGIATGATASAAIAVLRQVRPPPSRLVLAAPVAPTDTAAAMSVQVDELVVLAVPATFAAVGQWYDHFEQTTDDDVRALLET